MLQTPTQYSVDNFKEIMVCGQTAHNRTVTAPTAGYTKPCSGVALCTVLFHHIFCALKCYAFLYRAQKMSVTAGPLYAICPKIVLGFFENM
jgi:hypothetical protein